MIAAPQRIAAHCSWPPSSQIAIAPPDAREDRQAAEQRRRALRQAAPARLVDRAGAPGELRRQRRRAANVITAAKSPAHSASRPVRCMGGVVARLLRRLLRRPGARRAGSARRSRATRAVRSSLRGLEVGRERGGDDVADLGEVVGLQAAGRQRGGADAQAARDHRRPRVERHGVAVDRDADVVQAVLGHLAVELGLAQVDERQVHVGAAGQHVHAVAGVHAARPPPPSRRRRCAAGARGTPRSPRS